MSLVNSRNLTKLCLKNRVILYTAIRNHWNKDYKPNPYPQTQDERLAAAAKYGLVPSDYRPYPDDGFHGLGDYPQLPLISGDSKDPFYPWDSPELRRNFNEAMHADCDMMGEDRYDVCMKHRLPFWMYFAQFFGVIFGTFGLYYYLERMKQFPGLLPKQYYTEGKTHYTFEKP